MAEDSIECAMDGVVVDPTWSMPDLTSDSSLPLPPSTPPPPSTPSSVMALPSTWREGDGDWTLQIRLEGTTEITRYRVHQTVIEQHSELLRQDFDRARARKQALPSKYDDDFLLLGEFVEQSCGDLATVAGAKPPDPVDPSSTSFLELAGPLAAVVELVLEACYQSTLGLSSETAVAVEHLAREWQMSDIEQQARQFWQQDVSLSTLPVYYPSAKELGAVDVLEKCRQCLSACILELDEPSVLDVLSIVDAVFFHALVVDLAATPNLSLRLSLLVALYANLHKDQLNGPMLARLTDRRILPVVDVQAADELLQLEDEITGDRAKLTSLKERCIDVLSEVWYDPDAIALPKADEQAVVLPPLAGEALQYYTQQCLYKARQERAVLLADLQERRKEQVDPHSEGLTPTKLLSTLLQTTNLSEDEWTKSLPSYDVNGQQ